MNRSVIIRTISVFHQPDDVVEIRIPDAGQYRTISGYFDDQEKLATAIEELTEESYQGYYFTINSIDPALLARSNNRYKKYAKTTTADADVSLICWLPIDFDPVRPAGISSTDEEHREALEMAKRIRTNLIERGWPEAAFVLADSGNGGHLVVKIDPLDNNPENVKLIRQCLVALDYEFSDEAVKVDTSTHNPARIWKIYGTLVRKGDNTPDRPHRIARLLEVPDVLEAMPKKMLEELAEILPSDNATKVSSDGDDFDPEAWAMDHGLSVSKVKDWNDGVLVELETCPFNSEHHQTARIGRLASGARHFGCFHNGCQGKKWQDVRDLLERGQKHSGKKSKNSELIETNDVQPTIFTTDRHLQDITNEAMAAFLRINSPPHIFVRSDGLTRQKFNGKGVPVLQHLNENMLRGILARSAKYVRTKGRSQPIDYNPPLDVVRDILSLGSWPGIPPIEGLVESPVIRQDGTILDQPGYDAASALFYAPSDSLKTLNVPEKPSRDEAIRAAEFIISEVLYDFPFKDESSRANAIASMVSVIMRPAIDGNIPLALFDKPQAGTGASLLLEAISLIAMGRPAHMMSAPKDDEEWRKMITSSLIEGPAIIVIDNVDGILRASSLSRALTAKVWRDRILGRSEMIDLPQRAAWFATGNNIQLKGDLARRSYWIRMDAGVARPWMRTGFKHDDLLGWVKDHRSEILSALLTIVRAWFAAGRPSAKVLLLGGFNDWTQKVGGVLEFAGVTGFLGNRAELYDSMDLGVAQWDSFLSEWRQVRADNPSTSAELKAILEATEETYKDLQAAMPDDVSRAISKGNRSTGALGSVLSKHADQVYPSGLKLTKEPDRHAKKNEWRVIDTENPAGSGKKAKSTTIDDFAGGAGGQEHPSLIEKKVSTNVAYIERPERPPAPPANSSAVSDSVFSEYPQNKGIDGEAIKSDNLGLKEQIRRGEEQAREKEEHFSRVAESYIDENEDDATEQTKADRIRLACILEYGMNGWVDPRVVAHKLDVPVDDIVVGLESATNYVRKDKPGIIGYIQRVTKPKEEAKDRIEQIHGTSSPLESESRVDEGVCSNEN